MRSRSSAMIGSMVALALCAQPTALSADQMTDEERKVPPPPEPEPGAPANRPGETNRQLAARMKATAND